MNKVELDERDLNKIKEAVQVLSEGSQKKVIKNIGDESKMTVYTMGAGNNVIRIDIKVGD